MAWDNEGGIAGEAVGGSLWGTLPDANVKEVRSNGTTAPIYINATNGADGTLIGTFGATGLVLATAMALSLPGTVATTGQIRAAHTSAILNFLSTAAANLPIIATDGSNSIILGNTSFISALYGSQVILGTVTGNTFSLTATALTLTTPLIMGASMYISLPGGTHTAAEIRAKNSTVMIGFGNGAGGDIDVLSSDASNNLYIGTPGGSGLRNPNNTYIGAVTSVNTHINGTARLSILATAITYNPTTNHYFQIGGTTEFKIAATQCTINSTNGLQVVPPATTVAGVGDIRFGNNRTHLAAVTVLGVDMPLFATDASNNLWIGLTAAGATAAAQGTTVIAGGNGLSIRQSSSILLTMNTTNIQVNAPLVMVNSQHIALSGTVATIGSIREANATTVLAADAAGAGNLALVATDASDIAYFGQTAAGASQVVTAYLNGSTSTVLRSNATDRVTVSTTLVTTTLPIVLPGAAPATTGDMRVTKDRVVMACLHTDAATNLPIIEVGATNQLIIGDGSWASVAIEGPTGNTLTFDANNAIFTNPIEAAQHIIVTNAGPRILAGTGSPESAVAAPAGSLYLNKSGGASTSAYVKESGSGNTGWKAVINA